MNFPVSRLMKSDFLVYYNQDDFFNLIFQYKIEEKDNDTYVYLAFYAMNTNGIPMHDDPIGLTFITSDGIIKMESPSYLGNIDLSREFIEGALSDDDFLYFSFKAEKSAGCHGYIGYDIDSNDHKLTGITTKNPCPPDCVHRPKPPFHTEK